MKRFLLSIFAVLILAFHLQASMIIDSYKFGAVAAPPAPSYPAGITANIVLWLDALDSGTITTSGDYVVQWDDKTASGNNLSQATGSRQPFYDTTDNSVNFDDASSQFLSGAAAFPVKAGFFVVRNVDHGSTTGISSLLGRTIASNWFIFLRTNADYTISVDGATNNTGDTSINGGALTPGDGSGTNISVTDYVGFPNRNQADIVYFQIDTAEDFSAICLFEFSGTDYYGDMDVHEVLLYSDSLSTPNRTSVYDYLNSKWQ